jgi:hypothetical protein
MRKTIAYHERELGDAHAHLDPSLLPSGDLGIAQQGQCLPQTELSPRGIVQQRVQPVPDRRQLEAAQHIRQHVRSAHQRPPATASYSAKGRGNSAGRVGGADAGDASPLSRPSPWPTMPTRWRCRIARSQRPRRSSCRATSSPATHRRR